MDKGTKNTSRSSSNYIFQVSDWEKMEEVQEEEHAWGDKFRGITVSVSFETIFVETVSTKHTSWEVKKSQKVLKSSEKDEQDN